MKIEIEVTALRRKLAPKAKAKAKPKAKTPRRKK
jgi:hypothetical protein